MTRTSRLSNKPYPEWFARDHCRWCPEMPGYENRKSILHEEGETREFWGGMWVHVCSGVPTPR